MQKFQKSKTRLSMKPVHKPAIKKIITPSRDTLLKSTTLSSPTSASSSGSKDEKNLSLLNLDSDTELDTHQISKLTFSLKDELAHSLQTFKSATEEYIFHSTELKTEISTLYKNFSVIPEDINDLLLESEKSKENFEKIQNLVELSKNHPKNTLNIDLSSVKANREHELSQILENLKSEVTGIRGKVEVSEWEVKERESENVELRNLVVKMRESLVCVNDSKAHKSAVCNCILF